ncbi:NADPH-dependent FMN reductase [Nocardioides lijunqiniae]|uniref:NADPH-dependent FMN reductase n=1 Tax=Nocardioides lijunqiniae TaxID=2760832 RepID=UPI0018781989|nr:NAD(P)H-dependent oxidoreductase [Nocardioides lijunqiniae]
MTTTQHDQTTKNRAETAPSLRIAVIIASIRKDRMGDVIGTWVAAGLSRSAALNGLSIHVDLIDLASVSLPSDDLLEPGGGPRSEIADLIGAADGYVLVTPEYNHSYPASLKRAIDWHYSEWMFKAAAVVPYGVQGGLLAAEHLRGVLAELNVVTTRRTVGLSSPWNDLGEEEFTPSPETDKALGDAMTELAWWAGVLSAARRDQPFAL